MINNRTKTDKPTIAVHKFTSCDGCQLTFLNLGEDLISLSKQVDIIHFAEAGLLNEQAQVDIAFVEGSISTPDEKTRIAKIRKNSRYLITIGACATAGGIQALRNAVSTKAWMTDIYASPEHIKTLSTSTAIAKNVKVDHEIWGCPIDGQELLDVIRQLLFGVTPSPVEESLCLACKRKANVCVLVAKGEPCMGPVTKTGCGVLCPGIGRACYGCFGPDENPNTRSLTHRFGELGLSKAQIKRRFLQINNQAPAFKDFDQR